MTNVNPENNAYDAGDAEYNSPQFATEYIEPRRTDGEPSDQPRRRQPTSHARKEPERAGGFPLRGIAMVLIAVAVLLGLWGLYALTQSGDDAETNADKTADTHNTAPQQPNGAATGGPEGSNGDVGKDDSARGKAGGDDANRDGGRDTDRGGANQGGANQGDAGSKDGASDAGSDNAGSPNAGSGNGSAAGAGSGAGAADAAQAPKRVSVLNNSTVSNLAKDVSADIKNKGYDLGEVGNFSDEILPETTVFFPSDDAAAEEEAKKLASEMNGIARPNIDSLPKEATKDHALTVVLVDPNA